ncbi:MAG TPA: ABC transporter permease [Flavitalea sp.]|nr:ABC transporter permease [Flavitalea sp.]
MIKNYFKVGFRNLIKNKLSSSINILGLGLAVGCCLVVFEFLDWSMHMDNFHSKVKNLFVVERVSEENGNQQYWGNTPSPMGPMLQNDFPQIKNIARVNFEGIIIKQGDNVFRENVSFVDDSFYEMFDFPIKWGSKQHFIDQDGIVLTHELSEKIFGQENSIGKTLNIRFSNNGHEIIESFTVKGVLDKRPTETSFYFSALIPFRKMSSLGLNKTGDWSQSSDITFVEADNQAALSTIESQYKKYLKLYNDANQNNKISSFHFQPLKGMKFHAYLVNNQRFSATRPIGLIMIIVIAISILLLVYFNYMNIAIAAASGRLKEIGIRKVMGSARKQIIFQFILENLILCTIAVLIGLLVAKFIFLPWFNQFANIGLGQKLFSNYRTWVALLVLIIVSALSGSAYPSLYISAFNPINIMKGNNRMGSNNRFRKALLGFQFFLTFLTISTSVAFIQERKNSRARSWGYDPLNNVVVKLDQPSNFNQLKAGLKNNNRVKSVSGSVQSLGNYSKQLIVKAEGKELTTQSLNVLPGFASQLGITITKGRDLSEEFGTDQTASILVNQAFLKQMQWSSGVGKTIEYENHKYSIIGEINDFHYENFESHVAPIIILGCKPEEVKFAYIKTTTSLLSTAHSQIENVWKKMNPSQPFEYYYQEAVFDGYFNGFTQISQILSSTSLIMVIISITGIFGLALLILGKKMKEISVRKVLGAGIGSISFLINKEFLFAIGFATLFGFPISYWITSTILNQISPESKVSFSPVILAFLALIIMTLISVSWHIFKAHTANPTKYLKNQ